MSAKRRRACGGPQSKHHRRNVHLKFTTQPGHDQARIWAKQGDHQVANVRITFYK